MEADPKPLSLTDAAIGLAAVTTGVAITATRRIARLAAPLGNAVLHPPLLTERLHPGRTVHALAYRGREVVTATSVDLDRVIAVLVPAVLREVLDTLDLNALILERIDLNRVVRQVDIDAVVDRVDIDGVAKRIDIDAIADRIDLDRIVARIDLDAVVARVDLDAVVERLDLANLAEEVINEIDMPEIIRESTGSMASSVVRDARMQSIDADEALSRFVDRVLRRRGKRSTDAPGSPHSETSLISMGESSS
jgi:hypothetical protein